MRGRWLIDRFGLEVPVVSAPMAGVASGRLAAAVSRAGALGMVGVGGAATAEWIGEQCRVAAEPDQPFGVGLTAWILDERPEQLDAAVASGASLVSVSYGRYAPYVEPLRDAGLVVATQVGTLDEARAAEDAGVDVIVARGGEGGGHGRNDVATLPLLQAVLDTIETPVLAAGGIATARGLAAVLAAGCVGAWIGTAFVTCAEADTSAEASIRLIAAGETATAYGRVFDIAQALGWPPEFGGRALRNTFFERWSGREAELTGDTDASRELAEARRSGDFDTAYIYAGQAVGGITGVRPAADVVNDLAVARDLLGLADDWHVW